MTTGDAMFRSLLIPFLLALCAATSPVRAASAQSPGDVAAAYFKSLKDADWQATAALMHPAALQKFKDLMSLVAQSPNGKEMLQVFFQASSQKDFDNLAAKDIFRRFMSSLASLEPDLVEIYASTSQVVLGSVQEGEDVVHLVSRMTVRIESDVVVNQVHLVSLQRDGNTWRLLLTGDMEGLAEKLAGQ
jgi:hypothetical protein